MSIYHRRELMEFLDSLGIRPKKGLSQNFLIDANILKKIARTAGVMEGDLVLEIGPGPGALTETLLGMGAQVVAIEKDHILANALERLQTDDGRLKVLEDDALEVDVYTLLKEALDAGQKVKVIANLPYNITTPILQKMLPLSDLFSSLTVMVQDEVAKRVTSPPGSKVYGSLSVFSRFYSEPSYAFKVSKNCFFPAPKVDSAILHFALREPPSVKSEEHFFAITRTAFCYRRKMVRVSLKELYPSDVVANALERIGLDPNIRPEKMSLDDFLKLADELYPEL